MLLTTVITSLHQISFLDPTCTTWYGITLLSSVVLKFAPTWVRLTLMQSWVTIVTLWCVFSDVSPLNCSLAGHWWLANDTTYHTTRTRNWNSALYWRRRQEPLMIIIVIIYFWHWRSWQTQWYCAWQWWNRDLPGQGGVDIGGVEELKKKQSRLNDRQLKIDKWARNNYQFAQITILTRRNDEQLLSLSWSR